MTLFYYLRVKHIKNAGKNLLQFRIWNRSYYYYS